MSSTRGRRGGTPADGRRTTGRVPRVHSTRPVRTGLRSNATSRPGQKRSSGRRTARTASAAAARRRPLFTGRAVLLGGLVLLLALTLAGPVRQYLAGRAELVQLAAEGRDLDQRAADLQEQLERQADPAYAERQARERLTYVLPGDRLVIVSDGTTVEGDAGTAPGRGHEHRPGALVRGAPGVGGRRRRGTVTEPVTDDERAIIARQLGRPPRALVAVAHRCPCGQPDVVETSPRLEDGTPFPTLYYLTCPRATAAASRLESAGRMREWQDELATNPDLAAGYQAAHEAFLATRDARDVLPTRMSAGGMPDRVKCLHALAAHALAAGPGVNPIGDRAVEEMGEWWAAGPVRPARGDAVSRVAAIDCGTNSIRLLVADVPATGAHTDLLRRMEVVRLGQGVDATGRLAPEAIERTRKVLVEYADAARDLGAESVRMVATSATRDAANRADFEEMVAGRPRPAART